MSHKVTHLQDLNRLIPYAQMVGLEIERDANGLLTKLRALPDNIGNEVIGAIHGGVVGGLLEHAASFHLLHELLERDTIPRIINVSFDYLRPALLKDTYARGYIVKQGKRVANVRVSAWQDDENRPVACANAHFLIA